MSPPYWQLRTRRLSLRQPLVMGVLNVTPDSFSDGGRYLDPDAAVAHGLQLVAAGADLIDVGGESTRPGAEGVSAAEEMRRVVGVVRSLAEEGVVVSVDTSKPEVAAAAVQAGAEIVNDVTGFAHPRMVELAASTGVGVVVMHMLGTPRTMQDHPSYVDVVAEVRSFLAERARQLVEEGVDRPAIVIDPGIGFGKTAAHNLTLLNRLADLAATGFAVMVGPSRKSFLGAITGHTRPEDRDLATAVVAALAVERGAAVIRAHEPSSVAEAVKVATAIVRSED